MYSFLFKEEQKDFIKYDININTQYNKNKQAVH